MTELVKPHGVKWGDLSMLERFAVAWEQFGIDDYHYQTEYSIDGAARDWAFDVAFPEVHLAIEFDGFGFGHYSVKGRIEDMEKANDAISLGWSVMRFGSSMMSMRAMPDHIWMVCRAIELRVTVCED